MTVGRLLHVALVLLLFGSSVGLAAAALWVAVTDRREARRARARVITRAHLSPGLTTAAAVISPARRAVGL